MKKLALIIVSLAAACIQAENPTKIINRCRSENIQYVRFTFTDPLTHCLRSVLRPIHFIEDDIEQGLKIDGSSIPGCNRITNSDMFLKPDLSTATKKLPWSNENMGTISITCDLYQESGKPFEGDPRCILKREIEAAYEKGFKFIVGPELEFYITEPDSVTPIDTQRYFQHPTEWNVDNALTNMFGILNYLDLNIEKLHHEVAPGQYEVSLEANDALKIADDLTQAKQIIKSIARQWQKDVTFMPKPIYGENGSGMHINFSLYDINQQKNAFAQDGNSLELNKTAQHFIAGILKHIKAITLIMNPSINSYKRLVPGYEAPIFICCGKRNRSSLIRIPEPTSTKTVRGELRSPDPLCNPYLAFAALLKAGMEGIKEQLEVPAMLTDNLYALTEQEIAERNIDILPTSMSNALNAFKASDFARELCGEQLFSEMVCAKTKELAAFNQAVTDWEVAQYR